jgi:hypothetical protein
MQVSGAAAAAPRLVQQRAGVPESLAALVGRLLEKDPAQRSASAGEAAAELSDLVERLTAPPVSTPAPLLRPVVLVPTAGALLLAILGGVWLYQRSEKRQWAREDAIPEIHMLKDQEKPLAAFLVLQKAEQILPGDAPLVQAAREFDDAGRQGGDPGLSCSGERLVCVRYDADRARQDSEGILSLEAFQRRGKRFYRSTADGS